MESFEAISITVLYRASSSKLSVQYHQLIKDYPQVHFIEEKNFRKDLIYLFSRTITNPIMRDWFVLYGVLNGFLRLWRYSLVEFLIRILLRFGIQLGRLPFNSWCAEQYWLLSVDDNIFIRPVKFSEVLFALERDSEAIGFSLRLGKNINYCYMQNVPQNPPAWKINPSNPRILSFNWENAEYDFGYPLEISSTVYRASLLAPLIACLYFTTPNMLESKMASLKKWYARQHPRLFCYSSSVCFCNPLNKVQKDRPYNRSGAGLDYSVEGLAELFDAGKRIDIRIFADFMPNACHQEVDLKFM
ncbi:MAG: hypothetical protein N3D16_07665, partial [Anaerolineales bacterium]|nr:hypothetical protein [Anaerolineales bacterium]